LHAAAVADSHSSWLPRGPARVRSAFVWSMQGLAHAFRTESSFRLECYGLLVLGPLALWLGQTPVERAILFGCLLPVLAVELLNSALEILVNMLWPGHDQRAGCAKDMGSAAVFLCLVNVLVCWSVILWPRWS
jgi:diacylglycerol kinase (ATP)